MASTDYQITVEDGYTVPAGPLTSDQYVNFVMNMAAQSYMNQYQAATPDEGIQAACDAYNASLPSPEPAPAPTPDPAPAPAPEPTPEPTV